MAQTQTTIDGLTAATVLSLSDEFELDQYNTGTSKRQSRKGTLQQLASLLSGAASPVVKITAADSPYTALITEPVVLVDATDGPITINLPAITGLTPQMKIKKLDGTANAVTLVPQAGDTIEFVASYFLNFAGQSAEPLPYIPDNNWNVF